MIIIRNDITVLCTFLDKLFFYKYSAPLVLSVMFKREYRIMKTIIVIIITGAEHREYLRSY